MSIVNDKREQCCFKKAQKSKLYRDKLLQNTLQSNETQNTSRCNYLRQRGYFWAFEKYTIKYHSYVLRAYWFSRTVIEHILAVEFPQLKTELCTHELFLRIFFPEVLVQIYWLRSVERWCSINYLDTAVLKGSNWSFLQDGFFFIQLRREKPEQPRYIMNWLAVSFCPFNILNLKTRIHENISFIL